MNDGIKRSDHALVVYANTIQFARGMSVSYPGVQSRMVLLCVEGSGRVSVNGRVYGLEEHTLLVLPWNHSIRYRADSVDPFLLTGVHVVPWHNPEADPVFAVAHGPDSPLFGSHDRSDCDLTPLVGTLIGTASPRETTLRQLLRLCVELFHSPGFDRVAANSLARLLLREVANWQLTRSGGTVATSTVAKTAGTSEPSIAAVETWVLDHIHEHISLEQIAGIAGASVSPLRRMFVRTVGVSPYEWLLGQRIRVAQEMLRTGTQPVRSIADAVGVQDPAYFARLFASRVGCTPREYRRAHLRI